MNVMPYLAFNGNCAEALALYEKAFGVKACEVVKYSDSPPAEGYQPPPGTEDFVMHTELKLGAGTIYLCKYMRQTTPII